MAVETAMALLQEEFLELQDHTQRQDQELLRIQLGELYQVFDGYYALLTVFKALTTLTCSIKSIPYDSPLI